MNIIDKAIGNEYRLSWFIYIRLDMFSKTSYNK